MSGSPLSLVWEPKRIGSLACRNSLYLPTHWVMPVMAPAYGDYLAARARGGSGLIFASGPTSHPSTANPLAPDGWTRDWIKPFSENVKKVHDAGAPILVQLAHTGAPAMPPTWSIERWGPLWAPSPLRSPNQWVVPKELEVEDIADLIRTFTDTAAYTQESGADGIEVHCGHGYLLSNFFSPFWNRREDQYGGNTENRVRIFTELAAAVRARCGKDFAICVKMNSEDYHGEEGMHHGEAVRVVELLAQSGLVDLFSMAHVDYHSFHRLMAPQSSGETANAAKGSRAVMAASGNIPVLVQGAIRTVAMAEELLAEGAADMVGLVRVQIADPDIINKTRDGRVAEVRRCVGQNQGCVRRIGIGASCTVNPLAGREASWGPKVGEKSNAPKRIAIVGGGPAGLKFAETAALRGHHVTIIEARERLGGQVHWAKQLPDYGSWGFVADDLAAQIKRLGVEVRLKSRATVEMLLSEDADQIVVATGARWRTDGFSALIQPGDPSPPPMDCPALDPIHVLDNPDDCGQEVIVIDEVGDYTPLGIARILAERGRNVTIVTADNAIGRKLHANNDFEWLYPRTLRAGVHVLPMSLLREVRDGTALIRNRATGELTRMAVDTVVTCALREADDTLYKELKSAGANVIRIGDCVAPREVDDAIIEGFREAALV